MCCRDIYRSYRANQQAPGLKPLSSRSPKLLFKYQHSPGSGGRCMANGAIQLTAVYSHGCMNRIQLRAVGSSSGDMLLLIVGRINSTVGQLLHIAPLTFKTTPPYSNAIFDNTCFTVTALPPSLALCQVQREWEYQMDKQVCFKVTKTPTWLKSTVLEQP